MVINYCDAINKIDQAISIGDASKIEQFINISHIDLSVTNSSSN